MPDTPAIPHIHPWPIHDHHAREARVMSATHAVDRARLAVDVAQATLARRVREHEAAVREMRGAETLTEGACNDRT
jgi:hypothetical protein